MASQVDRSAQAEAVETVVSFDGNRDLAQRRPFFDVCTLLGITAMLAAMVLRRPDVLALATPFVVAVAAALATWQPVDGTVRVGFEQTRITEGQDITINVHVSSPTGLGRVELELFPSDRLSAVGTMRAVTSIAAGTTSHFSFRVEANEWGVARIQKMTVRIGDRFSMFGGQIDVVPDDTVVIGLSEDRITASLEAERFRRIVGSHLSGDRGTGMEIADVRPFQPGDSARHINWRITNRRHEPWVTLRHPDRSTTVVVIVDAHDGESEEQRRTQRRSVGAAMALSRGHLAMHDRVGLLIVGHTLQWVEPRLGRHQLFEIADQLVAVSNAPEASRRMYRPRALSAIPSNAIVVAVSPLRDPLMVALMAEIRGRGNPVSVLVPTDDSTPSAKFSRRTDDQSRRLATVEQRVGVQSLRERGVAIVPWPDDTAVVDIVAAVQRTRTALARAR